MAYLDKQIRHVLFRMSSLKDNYFFIIPLKLPSIYKSTKLNYSSMRKQVFY